MKKLFCVILSLILSFAVLAGCKQDEKTYTKVSIWHHYQNDQLSAFNNMVEEFNNTVGKEEGIYVSAETFSYIDELANRVFTAANDKSGDKMPQMFMAYSDSAFQIDMLGKLADLDKYFSAEELGKFVDDYIDEGRISGDKLKIFPIAKATEIFMINKTDWEKFKIDYNAKNAVKVSEDSFATYEGIVDVSKKYYETTGKSFFGRDALANYILGGAMQLGTEIFRVDNGKANFDFNKDVLRQLWDNYLVPSVNGYFRVSDSFASGDVKSNNILAYIGSSTSCGYFPNKVFLSEKESYDIETLVFPSPTFKDGSKTYIQQGAGFCVSKSDAITEAACAKFLKWFTETERNIKFSLSSGYLPVIKEAQDVNKIKNVINKNNLKVSDITLRTIDVAIGMVNSGKMYTNKSFKGGVEARQTLEKFKPFVIETIKKSKLPNANIDELIGDKAFNSWLESLEATLIADTK